MKTGTPSASLQGAGSPPRSLRTCTQGHVTAWPHTCPVCRAMAASYEREPRPKIVTMGKCSWVATVRRAL
jgi:hypothetical protein